MSKPFSGLGCEKGPGYSSVTTSRQCGIFVVKPRAWTFGSITIWASGSPWTRKTVRGKPASPAFLPSREMAEPGEQLALVGVRAEAADRADLAPHLADLAVELHGRRPGLEVRPERADALVADEQERRGRVVDQVAEVAETRPPVSIPFEATIMYGRCACAIFWESRTSRVSVWFG